MTLTNCTKEELIFIIERLQLYNPTQTHFVQRALNDVEMRREEKKFDEAKKISAYSHQKRQEYIDLLAPYEGKRLVDIPASVLEKADAAMREAQKADCRWNKIMGISGAVGGVVGPK